MIKCLILVLHQKYLHFHILSHTHIHTDTSTGTASSQGVKHSNINMLIIKKLLSLIRRSFSLCKGFCVLLNKITSYLSFWGGEKRIYAYWIKSEIVSLWTSWESQDWNDRIKRAKTILVWHERGERDRDEGQGKHQDVCIKKGLGLSWSKSEKMSEFSEIYSDLV